MALVTLEGMAVVTGESYLPGAGYSTIGELRLKQRNPLPHKGSDDTWSSSIINEGSLLPDDYDLKTIFKGYSARNCKFPCYYTIDFISFHDKHSFISVLLAE